MIRHDKTDIHDKTGSRYDHKIILYSRCTSHSRSQTNTINWCVTCTHSPKLGDHSHSGDDVQGRRDQRLLKTGPSCADIIWELVCVLGPSCADCFSSNGDPPSDIVHNTTIGRVVDIGWRAEIDGRWRAENCLFSRRMSCSFFRCVRKERTVFFGSPELGTFFGARHDYLFSEHVTILTQTRGPTQSPVGARPGGRPPATGSGQDPSRPFDHGRRQNSQKFTYNYCLAASVSL